MVLVKEAVLDLETPQGAMRTYVYEPKTTDVYQEKKYPGMIIIEKKNMKKRKFNCNVGLIFFSAIFQRTPGIDRMAKWLAGHGYNINIF